MLTKLAESNGTNIQTGRAAVKVPEGVWAFANASQAVDTAIEAFFKLRFAMIAELASIHLDKVELSKECGSGKERSRTTACLSMAAIARRYIPVFSFPGFAC